MHIAELDDPAVNQAEAHVLAHLASAGDSTIGQVHRAFGHRRSTLTSILDRLEQRNLIERTSDARDRRTFVVTLTRSGRAAARRVVAHLAAFERQALQGLPAADLRTFLRVLERFETDEG
jgi:DNA-binding MarR family transcriptional regulator